MTVISTLRVVKRGGDQVTSKEQRESTESQEKTQKELNEKREREKKNQKDPNGLLEGNGKKGREKGTTSGQRKAESKNVRRMGSKEKKEKRKGKGPSVKKRVNLESNGGRE